MDTVKFPCERCGKQMAVVSDDLGKPVECPHCHETVPAPPPAPAPAEPEPPLPEFRVPQPAEQESIFAAPEETGEDLFGVAPAPRLEMPIEPLVPSLQIDAPAPPEPPTLISTAPAEPPLARPAAVPKPPEPEPPPPPAAEPPPAEPEPEPLAEVPTSIPLRRPESRGVLGILLLIFLIPYALVSTAAVGWLLYKQRHTPDPAPAFDPLERLPDPKPGEGGPKRVKYDAPLPDKLKTALNQPLRVGDIEVTPLAVERTPMGELLLTLKLRNVSTNVAFDPMPDAFVRYSGNPLAGNKPYTFLALGPDPNDYIYGAYLERLATPDRNGRPFDGVLRPGEEETVQLRTDSKFRARLERGLDRPRGEILWRVHVRRGFVPVRGKDVSATAVVGVRIDPSAIRGAAEDASLGPPRATVEAAFAWKKPGLF